MQPHDRMKCASAVTVHLKNTKTLKMPLIPPPFEVLCWLRCTREEPCQVRSQLLLNFCSITPNVGNGAQNISVTCSRMLFHLFLAHWPFHQCLQHLKLPGVSHSKVVVLARQCLGHKENNHSFSTWSKPYVSLSLDRFSPLMLQ